MIHLHILWLGVLRFINLILRPFLKSTRLDNAFIEKIVNKSRVKLKATFSDAEMKIMQWLVDMINKYKKVSPIQKTLLNKKYNEVIKKNTNEKIDDLCDYIITVYNKNF